MNTHEVLFLCPKSGGEAMPANRDKSGRFLPGNNANPSGRPKIPAEVKEILKAACPDAARELVKFIHHKRPNIAM